LEKVAKQFDSPQQKKFILAHLPILQPSSIPSRGRKKAFNRGYFFFHWPGRLPRREIGPRRKLKVCRRKCAISRRAKVHFGLITPRTSFCVVLIFAKWINVCAEWQRGVARQRCPADAEILNAPQFGRWMLKMRIRDVASPALHSLDGAHTLTRRRKHLIFALANLVNCVCIAHI